ncbi:unnamed protein product [Tilletia controversa]|nr:unnamed protein product [Tilletia controversa]CAD6956902.1 unnamed protein product [Tilletia caries]CAD6985840.1 unnamed protein product [Tilletia controversa]CAD7067630.1 unnamed protein product [Tilletia caries]
MASNGNAKAQTNGQPAAAAPRREKPPQPTPDDKYTGHRDDAIHHSVLKGRSGYASLRDRFTNAARISDSRSLSTSFSPRLRPLARSPSRAPTSTRIRPDHTSRRNFIVNTTDIHYADTAFNFDKRDELGMRGLLPPVQETMAQQVLRCMTQLRGKKTSLGKYVYLSQLRNTNVRLFYACLLSHTEECLPLIYTPVVGEACQRFSEIYRRPEGLTISLEDKGNVAAVVDNWPVPAGSPRIAVVTDGSRILGLGDLGWGGLGIAIGKLSLYIAAAGIHPRATIPIVLDMGTNTQKYLDDPLYLGLRRKRPVTSEEFYSFTDEVMSALHAKFPNLIIQFEDFSTDNAFGTLDRYKNQYPHFNDDIQGTGCVILGGFARAARMSSEASGRPLHDQRILFFGAGSAGVGVAKQLLAFFRIQGLSEEEARDRIWLVDSKGLVTKDRGDKLPAHKVYFAREDNQGNQYKALIDVVEYVKPTALIGLSTVPDTFDETVLRKMADLNKSPIVFPLSNPSSLSECSFEQAVKYTNGKVIFAAGSPFPDAEWEGKTLKPGQGNNLYVFPGIGLAGSLCKVSRITDEMITEAALALADALNDEEKAQNLVYPSLKRVREVSRDVATRVIMKANEQKVSRDGGYTASMPEDELREWVQGEMWSPNYDTYTA